jgi:hypothetical protein
MAGWIAAATVGGALIGSRSSSKAASTQATAANTAAELQKNVADQQIALQREQFNRQVELEREQFNRQIELQAPFRDVGLRALNKLEGAVDYTPFGMQQFQADPGYGFRMSEGMKGLERSAAARGGLLSGATLKGIQRFGQDLASQEYQNAFNRYGAERERRLNPLQSLAGVGQTSAQQVGAAGQNLTQQVGAAGQNMASGIGNALGTYGQGASQALGAAGQARASGYMGQANAISGGLGQYLNYQQSNNLLNALRQNQALSGLSNAQLANQYYLNG